MALTYVTITGQFKDGQGNPLTGTATFTPSQDVYAAGETILSMHQPVIAPIVNGTFSSAVSLLATDNAGLVFTGMTKFFYWTVKLVLAGDAKAPWGFALPSSPASVDLFSLAGPVGSGGGIAALTAADGSIVVDSSSSPVTLRTGSLDAIATLHPPAADISVAGHKVTGLANGSNPTDAVAWGQLGSAALQPSSAFDASGAASTAQANAENYAAALPPALYPWQFRPEDYGAKGDGRVVGDVVINATTTITSATAAFTSADVGKTIMINGGQGATSMPLVTTIASVTNATTAVLTATATASGTACAAVIGTDDTAAINQAVQAAGTYALAHDYFAEVLFGAKIYMLATDRTQSGNGTTAPTFNTQIAIPYPNANGTTPKLVFHLTGAGDAGFYQYWESITPNLAGTALVSTSTSAPSTADATFGNQSVIGGPAGSAGFTGGFANVKVVVKGIQVVSPAYTNQYAFDFGYVSAMRITQSSAHILAPTGVNGGTSPLLKDLPAQVAFQSKIGSGLRAPVTGNNADVTADDFTVEGYSRALYVFDHFTAGKISTLYNDVALKIDLTQGLSGTSHGVFISLLGAEVYNGGISSTGSGSNYCPVYINLDAEVASPAYDISDGGNVLHGEIHFCDPANARTVVVSGASNLKIVDNMRGRGHMATPPAMPASAAAAAAVYRDAWVTIHTGAGVTISAITVDGVATGLTMAASSTQQIRVASGKTIALTYAGGTPTWDWWLD